jgi:hypothetical protein
MPHTLKSSIITNVKILIGVVCSISSSNNSSIFESSEDKESSEKNCALGLNVELIYKKCKILCHNQITTQNPNEIGQTSLYRGEIEEILPPRVIDSQQSRCGWICMTSSKSAEWPVVAATARPNQGYLNGAAEPKLRTASMVATSR